MNAAPLTLTRAKAPRDRAILTRLGFSILAINAKVQRSLPGGETVSQQVLVLFFQVRILAG